MVLDLMLLSCCLLSQMGKTINFRHQAFQGQWLHFRGQVRRGCTGNSGWNITFTFSSHQCGNTLRITKQHLPLAIRCPCYPHNYCIFFLSKTIENEPEKQKLINCTSPKFKICSSKDSIRKWKEKLQTWRKYYEITHLIKDLYTEYTTNSYKSPI